MSSFSPLSFFFPSTQRGTALLLEHLAGSLASTVSVTTHLDIAPQHHLFMKGRNGSNIKHITQRTGAQIHFPDPNGPQKKSTVYIQGTIESVCLARQYLMVGFWATTMDATVSLTSFVCLGFFRRGGICSEKPRLLLWFWIVWRKLLKYPRQTNDNLFITQG